MTGSAETPDAPSQNTLLARLAAAAAAGAAIPDAVLRDAAAAPNAAARTAAAAVGEPSRTARPVQEYTRRSLAKSTPYMAEHSIQTPQSCWMLCVVRPNGDVWSLGSLQQQIALQLSAL
jgi:hypothetical protein